MVRGRLSRPPVRETGSRPTEGAVADDQVVAEQGVDHFLDGVVGQGPVEGLDQVGGK
jgi:hypothetical protein